MYLAVPGLPHHHLHGTHPEADYKLRDKRRSVTLECSGSHGGNSGMHHSLQPTVVKFNPEILTLVTLVSFCVDSNSFEIQI